MSLPSGDIKLTHLAKSFPEICSRTPFYASQFGAPPGHMKIVPVIKPTITIIGRVTNDDYFEPAFEFDEHNAKLMVGLIAE